jgi:hypothetical protein
VLLAEAICTNAHCYDFGLSLFRRIAQKFKALTDKVQSFALRIFW